MKRQPLILLALASLFILIPTNGARNHHPSGDGGAVPKTAHGPARKSLPKLSATDLKPVDVLASVSTPPPAETPTSHNVDAPLLASNANLSHADLLTAAGVAPGDQAAADYIISHEGHYDPCVRNGGAVDCSYAINGGGLAYGVCQSLPGIKMASAGADWATNPITQIRWCAQYAADRYGGWWPAYNFWVANRVW